MIQSAYRKMLYKHEWAPVAILLCLGFALRLAALGAVPYGLNQDEASAGYEAWSLLQSGIDRNGQSWPVLLISWGSGQNALMTYLAIPFVALLGLTETAVRLPNALSGCLTLAVFWLLARRTRGRAFGVCALFLLAVNPWHIMMSRWALESNLLPFFLTLGIYLTGVAKERPWVLLGAAASFGISLYAYGTAFFFLPLFLVAAVVWLRRDIRPAPFCISLVLFALIALPVAYCQLINMRGGEGISVLGVTLPALTQNRQAATSVFGGGGWAAAKENFRSFLNIIWYQSDGLRYNSMSFWKGGLFYFFGLPTAAVGLAVSLGLRRDHPREAPIRIALLCALVCAFFIDCNINRINMAWIPMIYFSSLGFCKILCKLSFWAAPVIAGVYACLVIFTVNYGNTFAREGNSAYFPGLGNAIIFASDISDGDIYITNYVNQPYIFALFYTQTPPDVFSDTVRYADPDAAFRQVLSFQGFRFGTDTEGAELLILPASQCKADSVVARFGDYIVTRNIE